MRDGIAWAFPSRIERGLRKRCAQDFAGGVTASVLLENSGRRLVTAKMRMAVLVCRTAVASSDFGKIQLSHRPKLRQVRFPVLSVLVHKIFAMALLAINIHWPILKNN